MRALSPALAALVILALAVVALALEEDVLAAVAGFLALVFLLLGSILKARRSS
jgi:hypothetical protein